MTFELTFQEAIISGEELELERQRIAAITPFADAQTEAIRVVRFWTRSFIRMKADDRDIIDLQDSVLNSPAEQAVIDTARNNFATFLTDAQAATNLAELNAAWVTYRTAVGL